MIRTIGLSESANHTSLGGLNDNCPLSWVVAYGLIVSVLLARGWQTAFTPEYARVIKSPVFAVFARDPDESCVNLKASEQKVGLNSFISISTAALKSSLDTSPILCPLNESTKIPFLNLSVFVAESLIERSFASFSRSDNAV